MAALSLSLPKSSSSASLSFPIPKSPRHSGVVRETRKRVRKLVSMHCTELCDLVHPLFGLCEERTSGNVRQIGADENTLSIKVKWCSIEVLAIAVAVLLQAPNVVEVVVHADIPEPISVAVPLLQACRDTKILLVRPQDILVHQTVGKNLRIEKN